MKRKRLPAAERLLLIVILGVGLCALGTTYAAWTSGLNIRTNLQTGIFNMIFPDSAIGDYYVWITDEEGSPIEELDVELSVSKDGKQADLTFNSGLPVELLAQGYYIKVGYPLEQAVNNTISAVELVEPVLDESGEEVRMKAKSGFLMAGGTPYGLEKILKPFMIPLKFHTYKGVEGEEGALRGYLFLKLTEESLKDMDDMPEAIELDAEALEESMDEQMDFIEWTAAAENGAVIVYTCELPLYLDQNGAYSMDNGGEDGG